MPIDPTPLRTEIAARYRIERDGSVFNRRRTPNRAVSWQRDKDGYPIVCLYLSAGRRPYIHVHRLVALFFLPERPSPRHETRHLDGNKENPRSDNLCWGTQKENAADREAHGRTARGERHGMFGRVVPREVSPNIIRIREDIVLIRARFQSGERQRDIAKDYKVSQSSIWRALFGAVALLCIVACSANGQSLPSEPNKNLTPGAVATTNVIDVCERVDGHFVYSRIHRVWRDKRATCAKYGLDADQCEATEDDDLVPICAGGDNADPRNHWPQALPQAYRKDRIEWAICRAVCDGRMSLKAAQSYFLGADWLGVVSGD